MFSLGLSHAGIQEVAGIAAELLTMPIVAIVKPAPLQSKPMLPSNSTKFKP